MLGYLATLLYIFFAYYKLVHLIICLICFTLSIISLVISAYSLNPKIILLNNHIQIFLSSINLISKGIIISTFYNNPQNDNSDELLRVIIYEFVSTNIFIITKLEASVITSSFYFSLNLFMIILTHNSSHINHYYFLEGKTSFFVALIFYLLRKEWDYKLRKLFSEKYKFESFFLYTNDYLNGLNGYIISAKFNNKFFSNPKIYDMITKIFANNEDLKNDNDNYKDLTVNPNSTKNLNDKSSDMNKSNNDRNQDLINFFLKNLIFFEYYDKENIIGKQNDLISNEGSQEYFMKSNIY